MITFWFIIVLLTTIALLFILIPLFWLKNKTHISSARLHVALYRERLDALQTQLQTAEITHQDFASFKTELEKSLLNDVPAATANIVNSSRREHYTVLFLLIAFLVSTILWYQHLGYSRQISHALFAAQDSANIQTKINSFGSVANIAATMQQRLQQQPDAKGWFLLGKLYLGEQQFPQAVSAFSKAYNLDPQNPEIMLQYAQSLFFADQESLNATAMDLLNKVLQKNPTATNANNLLALNAYHHGEYQMAINYWEKLLTQFPPNSEDGQKLLAMINSAEKKLTVLPSSRASAKSIH